MQMQVDSMFPVTLISLFLKSLSSSMTLPAIRKTPPTSEMTLKKCRISSLRTSILRSSWKLKGQDTIIERCHTSSLSALRGILEKHAG